MSETHFLSKCHPSYIHLRTNQLNPRDIWLLASASIFLSYYFLLDDMEAPKVFLALPPFPSSFSSIWIEYTVFVQMLFWE